MEIPVVNIQGKLDSSNVSGFGGHLETLIKQGHNSIILEFSGLKYISSTGVATLIKYADLCSQTGGKMILVAVPKKIIAMLTKLGFMSFFYIAPSVEDARGLL